MRQRIAPFLFLSQATCNEKNFLVDNKIVPNSCDLVLVVSSQLLSVRNKILRYSIRKNLKVKRTKNFVVDRLNNSVVVAVAVELSVSNSSS